MAKLKWYGDDVIKRVEKATRIGINKTMGDGVTEAKGNHSYENQSGTAERSIKIIQNAISTAFETFGHWGSQAVIYFPALEFGIPGHTKDYSSLRPAAKKVYKDLKRNIGAAWRRSS